MFPALQTLANFTAQDKSVTAGAVVAVELLELGKRVLISSFRKIDTGFEIAK